MQLLGEDIKIKEAPEPTDIIWEHRHMSATTRNIRLLAFSILVFVVLMVSFVAIWWL